jgi:cell division protein FtsI (penicillin-binding protein 3)
MKAKGRYILISTALLVAISGMAWRVVSLQVFEKSFLRDQGDARTVRVVGTPAYRGIISDRNGEPLAISTPVNSVWLNPKEFQIDHPQLLALAAVLDVSLEQIVEKVTKNSNREFVYLQRHISPVVAEQIKKLEIAGVHLKPEYRRFYPAGEVVSHVVGFTDIDEKGQEGLEKAFDDWLQGRKGSKKVVQDRLGREIQILEGLREMRSGQNVILSMDQRLQYLAYRELKAAVTAHQAAAGSAVVIDVQTGEVLAMVNQPSFNPNLRIKCRAEGGYRNRAVVDKLEPGSVIKPFSVVNALQNGAVTPSTIVDTSPGWMTVGGHVVREDKNKNFGMLDVAGILKTSSNVGVSKLTLSLPPECLWETYVRLGFGTATGSGFPGESSGTLNRPPKKGSFVLATMAFGYGLSVTPLQLAQAYATLGAGGVKRPMTFLKQLEIPAGEQVIDPIVARQVVDMLATVVEQGSGAKAKVVGYRTAGKTGTVRKISASGAYTNEKHVSVFAGLAPASHPRFAIVVVVDDPKGVYYGSQVTAPIFSKIAAGALRLFNIPPDMIDNQNLRVASANEGVNLNE